MKFLRTLIQKAVRLSLVKTGQSGQTLVEYSFILVVISVCAILSLRSMGVWVGSKFSTVSSSLENAS